MTTLVEQVQAILNPLAAGGSSFGMNFKQPPIYPYITFFRVVNATDMTMDGPTDMQSTPVQIDCWSKSVSEVMALAASVQAAMLAGLVIGAITVRDLPPDPEVKVYRVSLDFNCWSTNS